MRTARRRGRLAAALAALAAPVTGCGVFGDSVPPDPGSFTACMADNGYESSADRADVDAIARRAGVGVASAAIDGARVTIAFERSGDDARATLEAYEARPGALGGPADEVLERRGSVVVVWDSPPTDEQAAVVAQCLEP